MINNSCWVREQNQKQVLKMFTLKFAGIQDNRDTEEMDVAMELKIFFDTLITKTKLIHLQSAILGGIPDITMS